MRRTSRKKKGIPIIRGVIFLIFLVAAIVGLYAHLSTSPEDVDGGKKKGITSEEEHTYKAPGKPRIHRGRTTPLADTTIAIIIDDIGYKWSPVKALLAIDAPIAFAILPFCPYSADAAGMIHEAKRDILLHLPMEPRNSTINPGEGALFGWMSDSDVREQMEKDLASVPYATGVNNHMGSAFMEDEQKLSIVFSALQERGLYFIDSRTTPHSQAEAAAKKIPIRFASRTLFLDNDNHQELIFSTIMNHLHNNNRPMIVIGHPYPATIGALKKAVPLMQAKGIRIVPPSAMVGVITKEQQ